MISRRHLLRAGGAAAISLGLGPVGSHRALAEDSVTLPFGNGVRPLVTYPGKRPLIGLTARPPQLETPFEVFNEGILTPNDAFFVRYHLGDIPLDLDLGAYRIEIGGAVASPLSLSLDDLKTQFEANEIVAVHQCSGNSRGFVEPRVAGGQLGNGAMGNARWRGVPLRAVLERAGVTAAAVQVSFNGLDGPVLLETPDFVKALDIGHAMDGEVLLAYAMNGEDLPWLNGFPVRLVVPGYFGTYWVKHLSEIMVLDQPFDGYWMAKAYRMPDNECNCVPVGTAAKSTVPIGKFRVRSFLTSVQEGGSVPSGDVALRGIAFDGGSGIKAVAVSTDRGASWKSAGLGEDLGPYSFREWTMRLSLGAGPASVMVRATAKSGETQPMEATWNPSGYLRNVVETTRFTVA